MNLKLRDLEKRAIEYERNAIAYEEKAIASKEKAKQYRGVIEDLKTTANGSLPPTSTNQEPKPSKGKQTLKQIVSEKLSDGVPKTMRVLYEDYILITGKKDMKFEHFSGRVAALENVKKHTFPNNPIETRYYRGLSDWFENDSLKEEYLNKIAA